MKKFEGILICTDLDGTLLRTDKTISEENLNAIEYFKANGGFFTFVTGRMPFCADSIYNTIKPNAPFGCINGGGLYDGVGREYIRKQPIGDGVMELVGAVDAQLPNVGFQVNTFDVIYFSKENEVMKAFREITGVENITCHYNDVTKTVAKIVFGTKYEDEMQQLEKLLKSHPLASDFDFIRSERTLYEILPKGIGKGCAIHNLSEYLNINPSHTIAVGDYNNDISMLEAAGIGVAVSNACPELKEIADYITVSNDENAIAQVICDIEDGKILM